MFSQFQTKLAFIFVAFFLMIEAAIAVVFYHSITSNIHQKAKEELEVAAQALERSFEERALNLAGNLRILALDKGFRDAVENGKQAQVIETLNQVRRQASYDISLIVRPDGTVISGDFSDTDAAMDHLHNLAFELPADGRVHHQVAFLDGSIYEIVATPIANDHHMSCLLVGTELDEIAAKQLKSLAAIEIDFSFLYRKHSGEEWRVARAADAVGPSAVRLSKEGVALDRPGEIARGFGGSDYATMLVPLGMMADDVVLLHEKLTASDDPAKESANQAPDNKADYELALLIYYSLDTAFKPYHGLFKAMIAVGLTSLLVLVAGSSLVARGVSRPIRRLAHLAENIADGEYEELSMIKLSKGGGEIGSLERGFVHMVKAVREREDHIRFQAEHDLETGLPNRLRFEHLLEEAIEGGQQFSVLMIELANLPLLRTILDPEYMRGLLKGVAERLAHYTMEPVAHFHQGSFCMLVIGEENINSLARFIMLDFGRPVTLEGLNVDVSIRIGIACYPDHGQEIGVILRRASAALEQASNHADRYALYDDKLDNAHVDRLSLMSDLHGDIKAGHVQFAYQPKLDLITGRVTSLEALVRWHSPTRGFVSPAEFIPLAEQTGEIRHLTLWGLEEVIAQCARWNEEGLSVQVGMNISASDLANRELPTYIKVLLADYGLPASQLYLEITESDIIQDTGRALEILKRLADMGIAIAIDDYGTGYSSLSYLKRLPVGELKIDKSFVLRLADTEGDRILVRSTIELGHNLGLRVTAEGVEDEASLKLLQRYGCDYVQGYHIARPLAVADVAPTIKRLELQMQAG